MQALHTAHIPNMHLTLVVEQQFMQLPGAAVLQFRSVFFQHLIGCRLSRVLQRHIFRLSTDWLTTQKCLRRKNVA